MDGNDDDIFWNASEENGNVSMCLRKMKARTKKAETVTMIGREDRI